MRILGTQINQRDDRIDKDVHIKHHQSGGKQPQISILVGVLGAGLYAAREALVKLRFFFSGGRAVRKEEERLPYNGNPALPSWLNWFGRIVSASRIAPYC